MNEYEYEGRPSEDEDLSPDFTRARRPRPSAPAQPPRAAREMPGRRPTQPAGKPNLPAATEAPKPNRSTAPVPPSGRGESSTVRPIPPRAASPTKATPSRPTAPAEKRPEPGEAPVTEGSPRPRLRVKRIALLLAAVLLLIGAFGAIQRTLLSVRAITVVTAGTGYREEEILAALSLSEGQAMWRVDPAEISAAVADAFPDLDGADVVKTFPGKITIIPTPAVPSYVYRQGDDAYILSLELKVLSRTDTPPESLPTLILSRVTSHEVGEYLTFEGTYDYDTVAEVAEELGRLLAGFEVDTIDISNKFAISVICESKYKLLFGDREDLAQKVNLVRKTLEDPRFTTGSSAEIDVSSGNKAVVKFTEIGN